ncbi:alpha/beta fold hydrolase [Micromonospora sp. NPDC047074]|uniref:alpha/beta fold hydrolase n=1 Tax=Micromonospora sp. NPDC047074 TaxID=3154339 RepID=UPI0033CC0A6A
MNAPAPQVQRHLVRTPAGYVHLRTTGEPDPDRPSLLFLHQVPASSRIWLPVMRGLAPLHCVAPDSLNLGESDSTPAPLDLGEQADLLWSAAQEVSPGPKVVVGHHTGAALAALIAARNAAEVRGLGLIGYPHYPSWQAKFAKFERLNPVQTDPQGEGVAAVWRFIQRAFATDADPDLVFDAFADRIRAGRIWYEGYVALFSSDLERIAVEARDDSRPTLLVAPERDVLSASADEVGALLGVEPVRTSGGAFVLTEDPPVVVAQVQALWQAVVRG